MISTSDNLLHLGTKSGSRTIFREVNIPHSVGTYFPTTSLYRLKKEIVKILYRHPHATKGVIKLNEGFSGAGNTIVNLEPVQNRIRNGESMTNIMRQLNYQMEISHFVGNGITWDKFLNSIYNMGAIFELFVKTTSKTTSPSVQGVIESDGTVQIISTHDQILTGQSYEGCIYPAQAEYRSIIMEVILFCNILLIILVWKNSWREII